MKREENPPWHSLHYTVQPAFRERPWCHLAADAVHRYPRDMSSAILPPAQTPTCSQPGGGFCANLELAWGRVRRACLRRLFPGYVRRMVELRQGDCPDCPHDIIDSRDLKYARPACGFWFRARDDRFAWRDRLGVARAGLAELLLFSLAALVLAGGLTAAALLIHWAFWLPLAVVALGWLGIAWFFRDPERTIPDDAAALLSPADGTVTHVEEVAEPDFPGGRALRVSIFLSIFNVHVNRVPRISRVVRVRYFPALSWTPVTPTARAATSSCGSTWRSPTAGRCASSRSPAPSPAASFAGSRPATPWRPASASA